MQSAVNQSTVARQFPLKHNGASHGLFEFQNTQYSFFPGSFDPGEQSACRGCCAVSYLWLYHTIQIGKVTECYGLAGQCHMSELFADALIKGYQLAFIHIHI